MKTTQTQEVQTAIYFSESKQLFLHEPNPSKKVEDHFKHIFTTSGIFETLKFRMFFDDYYKNDFENQVAHINLDYVQKVYAIFSSDVQFKEVV